MPIEEKVNNVAWYLKSQKCDEDALRVLTCGVVKDLDIVGSTVAFVPFAFDSTQYYYNIYSTDVTGELVSKQIGSDSYDYFSMDWFRIPYETKKPYWSDPYFDEGGGNCLMSTYSYPLVNQKGSVYAVVTADITLEWMAKKSVPLNLTNTLI